MQRYITCPICKEKIKTYENGNYKHDRHHVVLETRYGIYNNGKLELSPGGIRYAEKNNVDISKL